MKQGMVFLVLIASILSACAPGPAPTATPFPTAALTPTCEPPFIVGETIPGDKLVIGGVELRKVTISGEELAKKLGIWPCGSLPGETPVPLYPGTVQSTEIVSLPADVVPLIPDVPIVESRHYLTSDTPDQVLSWYEQTLPKAGFEYRKLETGVIYFRAGNWHYGLFATATQGKTYIFIAAGYK